MNTANRDGIGGRNLFLVTVASMLVGGYAIMLLVLTLMYGNDCGFSPFAAGVLSSVFSFSALACRPFSGSLCDRFQPKRLFLLASAGFALTPLVFIVSASYFVLVLMRILQGICMSLATTAAGAIAAVIIPRERFTEGIGYYGIGMAASSAVAPGIGIWLLNHFGYAGVFLFSSAVGVGSLLLMLPVCCITVRVDIQHHIQHQHSFIGRLYEKTALFSALCTLLLSVVQVTIMQFLDYYVASQGGVGIGHFYTVSAIAVIMVRFLGGQLRKLTSDRGILLTGTVILLSAYVGLFSGYLTAVSLCVLAILYGIGHSMTGMILNAMAIADTPKDRIGAANATYLAASDFGYALGPIFWNTYCNHMGYRYIYLIAAAAVLALLLIFVIRIYKTKRNN